MYQERILLTGKDILEKEFKIDTRGYRPQEVDKFLDVIIRDYEEFMVIINAAMLIVAILVYIDRKNGTKK